MDDRDLMVLFQDNEEKDAAVYTEVKDLVQAENTIGHIAVCENNIERYKSAFEWLKSKVNNLIEREEEKIQRAEESLKPFVKKIIDKNLEMDKNAAKSIKFMFGKAGFRKGQDKIDIVDEHASLDSCHSMAINTIVKESVSKSAVMKHIKNGGAIPRGIEVIPAEEHFYVKVEK